MWINNEISDDLLIKSNVPKKCNIARIPFHIKRNLKGIVHSSELILKSYDIFLYKSLFCTSNS